MTSFTPFDAADYLDSDEAIAAYLTAALERYPVLYYGVLWRWLPR